jgi:hypothetical protein
MQCSEEGVRGTRRKQLEPTVVAGWFGPPPPPRPQVMYDLGVRQKPPEPPERDEFGNEVPKFVSVVGPDWPPKDSLLQLDAVDCQGCMPLHFAASKCGRWRWRVCACVEGVGGVCGVEGGEVGAGEQLSGACAMVAQVYVSAQTRLTSLSSSPFLHPLFPVPTYHSPSNHRSHLPYTGALDLLALQWLVAHGSDPTRPDKQGLTALHHAAQATGLTSAAGGGGNPMHLPDWDDAAGEEAPVGAVELEGWVRRGVGGGGGATVVVVVGGGGSVCGCRKDRGWG